MNAREFLEGEKKLGFGCLRLPHATDNPSDVDVPLMERMVDEFLASGFRYFDTAYSYLNYKSELFVKQTLTSRYPRDSYILTTKLPCLELKEGSDPSVYFDEQLQKCGVDFFDFYLLHSLNASVYQLAKKLGCFEELRRRRAQGQARFVGFSFHDTAETLDLILTEQPDIDAVQIQLNYLDWENPVIQSKACLEVCRKHGKPVIVMEPVKGGSLANVPKAAQEQMEASRPDASPAAWALRFAASQPGVAMVLSGMGDLDQIRQNAALMKNFEPLSADEFQLLQRCANLVRASVAVPCTGCAYCADVCPQRLPIPRYFALYNEHKRDGWQANAKKRYWELAQTHSLASSCAGCRQCEAKCPQHLTIADFMAQVSAQFDPAPANAGGQSAKLG